MCFLSLLWEIGDSFSPLTFSLSTEERYWVMECVSNILLLYL